jgi:hypothetical protein
MAVNDAMNAVENSWCLQSDHRGGDIAGIVVNIEDRQGTTLTWKGSDIAKCR